MEKLWEDKLHKDFWHRLLNQRVDSWLEDPTYLRSLRHDWEGMSRIHKRYAPILEERGLDLMQMVMRASVPPNLQHMDEEDEQKMQTIPVNPSCIAENLRDDMPLFSFSRAADWCPTDVLEVILSFARLEDESPTPSEPDCTQPEYDEQGHYGHFGVAVNDPTFSPLI